MLKLEIKMLKLETEEKKVSKVLSVGQVRSGTVRSVSELVKSGQLLE